MSFYTDHTDSVVLRHGDNARIQVLRDSDQDYANVLHCWGTGTGVNRLYLELRNEEAIAERGGEEVHADFETDADTYTELQAQGEAELARRSTIRAEYAVELLDPDLPYIGVGDRVLVVDPRTGSVVKTEVTDESRSWSPTGEVVELGLGGGSLASPIENIIRTQGRKPRTSLGKRPRPPQNVRTKTLFDGIRLEWTGDADAWEIWHVKGEQEPSEKDWDRLARVTSAEYDHLGLAFGEGHWYRIISVVGTRTSEPVIVFARAGRKVQEEDIDRTPPNPPTLGPLEGQAADLGNSRYDIRVVVPFTTDDRTRRVIFERREGTDGDWTEVGEAHSSPWIDRQGLKTETTYYYRARAESGTGVLSSLSNTRQVTIGTASVRPAMVTGLAVDFEGADLVATWNPVAGATSYRVEIVGRRTVTVAGTSYRYTLQENKLDGGGTPAPILVVRVWAQNAFGNESLQYAEMSAVHATPAKPTGLVAIPVVGGFVLTWNPHSPPPSLDRWVLQRASSENNYATWATINDEIRSAYYTDVDGISYDYQYKYRLIAVSPVGSQSDPSDETTPTEPGKVSLASQVIGRLARGQLAEEIIAELDGIVQIQEDLEDLSGDVSSVVQTAQQLSQAVAQVEEGLITAQSEIQQNADQIALRVQGVRRKDIVKARFSQLPNVGDATLQAGLTLDDEPVDFETLLDGVEQARVEVTVRRGYVAGGWDDTSGPIPITGYGYISGIVRGASEYLAYGPSNDYTAELHKSPDGKTWTNITEDADFDIPMYDIVYSQKYGYVGVGDVPYEHVFTRSTDGVNWSTKYFMPGESLYGIACDPGTDLLVAVGYDWNANQSLCLWSDDGGSTWYWSNLNDTAILWGVAHGDAGFVAVGYDGTVWRSADGKNWTKVTPFTTEDFGRVFWTGHEYIAPTSSPGVYATSLDGLNWTMRHLGVNVRMWSAVGIGDLRLIGAGSSLFYSYDGQTWEEYTAAPSGVYYGAASETEAVMVSADGQVVRYVLPQEGVEETYEVGQVVSYTSNTLTLDQPWTEENIPENLVTDHFVVWYYGPQTNAQIVVAQVDNEGHILLDARKVLVPGTLVADDIQSGTLRLTEDMTIESEDGRVSLDPQHGLVLSSVDGVAHFSPQGMFFEHPNGTKLGFVRGVQSGIAEDGDVIRLPFDNPAAILLYPIDMMTYDPSRPTRQRIRLLASDASDDTGQAFRIHAATIAEEGAAEQHTYPNDTSYYVRLSAHLGRYCARPTQHKSVADSETKWSSQIIRDINSYREYTTVGSDVSRIVINLREMMHTNAFAGNYVSINRMTYRIDIKPAGASNWMRTIGPVTRSLSAGGSLFTQGYNYRHALVTHVFDRLPPDKYTFRITMVDKQIGGGGYNYPDSQFLLVESWLEDGFAEIVPTSPPKVGWLALESGRVEED